MAYDNLSVISRPWNRVATYIIDGSLQTQQQGFRKLKPVDSIVVPQVIVGEGRDEDVQSHLGIFWILSELFLAEHYEVA